MLILHLTDNQCTKQKEEPTHVLTCPPPSNSALRHHIKAMEDTRQNIKHNFWTDAIDKQLDTKKLKVLLVQKYGLEAKSNDRDELDHTLRKTNAILLRHLSELAKLVEDLHCNQALKLSQAKAQFKLIAHIEIKAQTRADFNYRLINLLSISDHSAINECKSQYSLNDFLDHLYRILKYKSFSDSSRLENVHIRYHKSTSEQLIEKYRKLGEIKNETV